MTFDAGQTNSNKEIKLAAETPPETPPERLLSEKIVYERTSLSRVTRWQLAREGKFPAPVRISPGRIAWTESSVTAWIAAKVAAAAA